MKKETETQLTPQLLDNIQEMFAEGLTLQEVADMLQIPFPTLRGYASSNIPFREAIKAGEQRAHLKNLDKKRRNSLAQKSTWFIPTQDDIDRIEELARLGWFEVNICQSFELTTSVWGAAKKQHPMIGEALERGYIQSNGRKHNEGVKTWRPTPEQLVEITDLAGLGYTPPVISRKMGLGASYLEKNMGSMPEVLEAYENGLADWEAGVTDKLNADIAAGRTTPSLFYALKSRRKRFWSDAAPSAAAVGAAEKPGVAANTVSFEIVKQKPVAEFNQKAKVLKKAALSKKKAQE